MGEFVQGPQADPQDLRSHPRGNGDAESDRGPAAVLRGLPAARRRRWRSHAVGPRGGIPLGLSDQGLCRSRGARLRQVRARGPEVRRRGVPSAWHDLCRAAARHAQAHRLGRRRGDGLAQRPRHQGAGRLHGRHAAHDGQRHLRHQRHRARHRQPDAPQPRRLLRPRSGQDAQLGQVPLLRADHSLSRLVAGLRVRRQGSGLCAHRPAPQAAGDDAVPGARPRPGDDPPQLLSRDRAPALRPGLEAAVPRRAPARPEARHRPRRRQDRRDAGRGRHEDDARASSRRSRSRASRRSTSPPRSSSAASSAAISSTRRQASSWPRRARSSPAR